MDEEKVRAFSATNTTAGIYISYTLRRSCLTAVIDARRGDRLSPRQTCPLLRFGPRNARSLIGPPFAGQKVHRWTYLSLPFLHMSLGSSSFVERRFQFASRRFFVINLQTAQRRNAKSKREKEKGTEREIQRDTMPGINERVNKSKEERAREKEGKREVAGQRARGQTKREMEEIESEGERAGRRREHGDQSAAVYPLFAGVR